MIGLAIKQPYDGQLLSEMRRITHHHVSNWLVSERHALGFFFSFLNDDVQLHQLVVVSIFSSLPIKVVLSLAKHWGQ